MRPIIFLILIKHILYLNKSRFEAWLIPLYIQARQNIEKAFIKYNNEIASAY